MRNPDTADRANTVSFFLNGESVEIADPSPDLLLIDYLRSPEVGLSGPKKPCGQGGCGGCTVILSQWDDVANEPCHAAINSCLRPVVSVNGMVVTTIEGTGSARPHEPEHLTHSQSGSRHAAMAGAPVTEALSQARIASTERRKQRSAEAEAAVEAIAGATGAPAVSTEPGQEKLGVNPVAWRLAMNNGTQCGYCTVGFVMNMSEFLVNNPEATKKQIEEAFDGNICRCTGYRAILTGMKTFASDWSPKDEERRMKCHADPEILAQRPDGPLVIPFPEAAKAPATAASLGDDGVLWLSPGSLEALCAMMREHADRRVRLVAANTGYGIYKDAYQQDEVLLNLAAVPEVHGATEAGADGLTIPAGTTYTELLAVLETCMAERGEPIPAAGEKPLAHALTRLGALHFLAHRTAGRIVRNAATVGGNTMLMLHNIHGHEEPFPSDLSTGMVGVGAEVSFADARAVPTAIHRVPLAELVAACVADPALAPNLVLTAFHLPYGVPTDMVLPQKVALRDINAHSIVNAASRLSVDDAGVVREAVLPFGALAANPWRATRTEAAMVGQPLSLDALPDLCAILQQEVAEVLAESAPRMAGLPDEGFTAEYRTELAVSYLAKAVINALMTRDPECVPSELRSAGEITWGRWPVSYGTQDWSRDQDWKAPVALPYVKTMALNQATGQVHYAHELPVPARTVNASLVQSTRPLAMWHFLHPLTEEPVGPEELAAALRTLSPEFIDLVTAADVPETGINLQGMGADQPVFAEPDQPVNYVGQTIAMVCATTETAAAEIADIVSRTCVGYTDVPREPGKPDWWYAPMLSIEDAIRQGSIYPDNPKRSSMVNHIWRITRPGSRLDWADRDRDPTDRAPVVREAEVGGIPCLVVGNSQSTGGQIHFYMEPQATLAEPTDKDIMVMHPSTQSPMEMHQSTAMILGAHYNKVDVRVPQVGGGFGGKTEQTRFVAAAAALGASKLKRPVRLTLTREQDTAMIGKRHAYYGQYEVAIDAGAVNPDDKGRIHGFFNRMWGDGGAFYDCSFIVSNCIQTRADAAYMVENFQNQIDVCRTNHAPSTAMRAFGDIQCKLILENAVDDAAYAIGMRAEDVREKNLYQRGDVTPFGQALTYCYMGDVWKYLKDKACYEKRLADVVSFNANNRYRKRGLAMIPTKYGSGYNLAMLEQATALISIYQGDGSVVIHQGGVEMGQGLITQMRQIAAYVLDLPLDMIVIKAPVTSVIPNPTSTGGSTGTAYNGEAVKQLCLQMRGRLTAFAEQLRIENGPDWCAAQHIDYWNHPETGWRTRVPAPGGGEVMMWQNIVELAYQHRLSLTDTFNAVISGGDTPTPALEYKPFEDQPEIPGYTPTKGAPGAFDNFVGFTYSGACSVVEVDILTGETKVLSSDLVYDMGWSLNPAIDIGQVEGAFIQGLGYVLSEKLVFQPDGPERGRLNTLNTWRYKPPATTSIPLELNTHLFPRDKTDVPEGPHEGVLSSKEVGEPPLVLAATVFLAVKDAVRASRVERGLSPLFRMDAPADVQEVRRACALDLPDWRP